MKKTKTRMIELVRYPYEPFHVVTFIQGERVRKYQKVSQASAMRLTRTVRGLLQTTGVQVIPMSHGWIAVL